MIEMHKNTKVNLPSVANILDNQEQRVVRAKRRTNDESQVEQDVKKPKRVTRSRSAASSNNTSLNSYQQDEQRPKRITRNGSTVSTSNNVPIAIKQSKQKISKVNSSVVYLIFFEKEFLFRMIKLIQ
jgi:hypothetical protein